MGDATDHDSITSLSYTRVILRSPCKRRWSLQPVGPILIVGDENLVALPDIPDEGIQIVSFPGLTSNLLRTVIDKLPGNYLEIKTIILSLGTHHTNPFKVDSFKHSLRRLYGTTREKFPRARIWFPLIGHPLHCSETYISEIDSINSVFKQYLVLKTPPPTQFFIDNISHIWTWDTGQRVWDIWNLGSKLTGHGGVRKRGTDLDSLKSNPNGNVLNLAPNFTLSDAQLSLLQKGLSFIPSMAIGDKNKPVSLIEDLSSYHRRLKLAAYFMDQSDVVGERKNRLFLPKSDWEPKPAKVPKEVRNLIQANVEAVEKIGHAPLPRPKPNLTQEEVWALRALQEDPHIVIKPADKGSVTVIMDRFMYIAEGNRQLGDSTYYTPIDTPMYKDTAVTINNILLALQNGGFIQNKQYIYLKGETDPKQRHIYFLPKIHKDPSSWPVPHMMPAGRPIVSDCGSETYRISEYIDSYLNPLSMRHPSYVRDTYDFIDKIKAKTVNTGDYIFSMDVDSLYTNIGADAGLKSVRECFNSFPVKDRPDDFILELLEVSLKRNDFTFDNQVYLQTKGVAMGKKFAPALANIFMAAWEQQALQSANLRPSLYLRFLDDIFGIWPHSLQEFEVFTTHLNSIDPSIKVKQIIDSRSIDFLDTTVFKGEDFSSTFRLATKVYFKPTDTHALLHRASYHPQHTFLGIIKSQILRFKRLCSRPFDFHQARIVLFRALHQRGYSRSFLKRALSWEGGTTDNSQENPILPMIMTFSPMAIRACQAIRKNFDKYIQDPHPLREYKSMAAFKRNSTLGDYLVHSKLKPINPYKRRGPTLDSYSRLINKRQDISCKQPRKSGSLDTTNCVYALTCHKCGLKYVGETGRSLRTRWGEHRGNFLRKKKGSTTLIQHSITHGEYMSIMVLEANPTWTQKTRRARERSWIASLGTLVPWGLNDLGPKPLRESADVIN